MSVLAACTAQVPVPAYASHGAGSAGIRVKSAATRPAPPVPVTRAPSAAVSVLDGTAPGTLTAALASTLFASSPVVVVSGGTGAALAAAAKDARAAHAPLLLAAPDPGGQAQVAVSVRALHPAAVLAEGMTAAAQRQLASALPGVKLATRAAELPVTGIPAPLSHAAVLLQAPAAGQPGAAGGAAATAAVQTAAAVTAEVAGAAVVTVAGTDPRTDPAAIKELARLRPGAVVAVGAQFGPVSQLASRVAVAETGRQLPGGGQVLFPGRRLVALYGHPGAPGLGVLGHQDLAASIARARKVAAEYQPLSHVPVVPAFEIIASVAEASPGADGTYSYETPVSQLLPWVRTATADGLYVVLDLQPGRASLLSQAKYYQSLLELPDVGLALDAEWKLQPGQKPLQQIGHVNVSEVNGVGSWLAALTARNHLPQKLLVLHQFQLSMLTGERNLDTGHDNLAIVIHMDGQGTPAMKQATWNAVTAAAPRGVFFGWKNFLVKDHPMLTPGETMAKKPTPVMISYQ
ncbi:MAG TPA: hypothetical protein VFO01_07430 [Trebonia sp.]|nr:hypothetical protein [Trebonia sp.]